MRPMVRLEDAVDVKGRSQGRYTSESVRRVGAIVGVSPPRPGVHLPAVATKSARRYCNQKGSDGIRDTMGCKNKGVLILL